jgi:hypothetical protein
MSTEELNDTMSTFETPEQICNEVLKKPNEDERQTWNVPNQEDKEVDILNGQRRGDVQNRKERDWAHELQGLMKGQPNDRLQRRRRKCRQERREHEKRKNLGKREQNRQVLIYSIASKFRIRLCRRNRKGTSKTIMKLIQGTYHLVHPSSIGYADLSILCS